METTINERIKLIENQFFSGNTVAFAKEIGVKQPTLRDIVGTKQNKPSCDTLEKIVANTTINISPDWLLLGTGEMIRGKESIIDTKPRVPHDASAGILTDTVDGVTEYQCERVPVIKRFPKYDFTIMVHGESMQPNYMSGDEVACLRISDRGFLQWGKVYVLDTSQGVIIKRIYDDGDCIRCVSYNPEYHDFSIPKEEIRSFNLVVGTLRL